MDKTEWRSVQANSAVTQKFEFSFYPSASPWTMVLDNVSNVRLKIEASGTWSLSEDPLLECGPDGTPVIPNADCVTPDGPAGALLAKLGGGSAELKPKVITVVGSSCILVAGADGGPLFLGMNLPTAKQPCFRRPPVVLPKSLTVTIFEAKK